MMEDRGKSKVVNFLSGSITSHDSLRHERGDDAAVLLCEVKGPHTLQQRTLGRTGVLGGLEIMG